MLVLSRKPGEALVVGKQGDIEVSVLEIRGDRVRLGIKAPQEVTVHRMEVWVAIHGEQPTSGREARSAVPAARKDGGQGGLAQGLLGADKGP